jgi:aerobic-type carbon monoxide dehydrogenase small subunit (CoxS/CutS family)
MTSPQNFKVNGEAVSVDVPPNTPLMFVLRNDLGLRATRHGCAEGECGACTVLIDGRPMTSCNVNVEAVAGANVETVESLAEPQDRLLSALLDHQAGQCGYCLAGVLMRAKALVAANKPMSRKQIAEALDEHLCRCGAHPRILNAIESVVNGAGL